MSNAGRPHGAGAERHWADAAALVLLSVGGVAAWWGALGDGMLWLAPVIAVAALTTAGALRVRVAMVVVILWLPGSILAAGLSAGVLAPAALDTTSVALHDGLEALPTIDTGTPVIQVWALAAVLLIAGTAFGLAGILWRGSAWWRTLGGFAMLLAPLAGAVATQQTPDASWIGALVLVAVVLRIAHGRTIPIVATASMVGAVALFGAQVAAPRAGWAPFGHSHLSQFHELDTAQTYGPQHLPPVADSEDPLVDAAPLVKGLIVRLAYATPGNIAGRALYPADAKCLLRKSVTGRPSLTAVSAICFISSTLRASNM